MSGPTRVTRATRDVLRALLAATEDRPAWGFSICHDTGRASWTVYPILDRLQAHGLVTAQPEADPSDGRPPRRYYQLTDAGRRFARDATKGGAS